MREVGRRNERGRGRGGVGRREKDREEDWVMILEHSFFGPLGWHSNLEAGLQEPDSPEGSVAHMQVCVHALVACTFISWPRGKITLWSLTEPAHLSMNAGKLTALDRQ